MMIFLEAALLTCMAVCGALCAISDCRRGLVPNRILLWGFLIGAIFHVGLLTTGSIEVYSAWLVNMILADLLAFAMYYHQMWAAGDAKLFMLMFFLFPPRFLDNGSFAFCVIPYIFIFIPALAWVVLDSIVCWLRKESRKKQPLHSIPMIKNLSINMLESSSLYIVCSYCFSSFVAEEGLFFSVLMIVYVFVSNSIDWMRKWSAVLAHAVIIFVFTAINSWEFVFPEWYSYLILVTVIACQHLLSMYNYKLVPTNSIRKGMILSTETVLQFRISKVHGLPTDASEELSAKVTDEQAAAVKRWENSAHGQSSIWIVRKVPFAIMIWIGFVLWSVLRIGG